MIILGIITLIAGVLLSSIPWLDYFLIKVWPGLGLDDVRAPFNNRHSIPESQVMEQHAQFPLLAAARSDSPYKVVHIQRHQSGRVSARREAQAGGSRPVCLQVRPTKTIMHSLLAE